MKKIFIMCISIVLLITIGFLIKPKEYKVVAQYVRTYIESNDIDYPVIEIISSNDELDNYYRENCKIENESTGNDSYRTEFLDACKNYDEKFFKEKDIIVVLLEERSGSISHLVEKIKKNSTTDKLEISIKRTIPMMGTSDMAWWYIIMEVPKGIVDSKDEVEILFEEDNEL